MESEIKAIDTKLQLLALTNSNTQKLVEERNQAKTMRQKKTLEGKLDEIHEIKVRVQEQMIESEKSLEEVQQWADKVEKDIQPFEESITEIDQTLKALKETEKHEEEKVAREIREKKFEEEIQFEKRKLEEKFKFEKKFVEGKGNYETTAKLPRLIISTFNGTPTDWVRFWSEFEAEIDHAKIPNISKFSYLKELLDPQIRGVIDGLPFTVEGYERAKNILKQKYGKTSVIVNAHVTKILFLPVIQGSNPNKIHEFYEQLLQSVQSLETLGKLREVNGYTRTTLDKLEGIRGDLVRLDDDWEDWDFPKLVNALQKWTQRNPPKSEEKSTPGQGRGSKSPAGKSKTFQTKQRQVQLSRPCVYCESEEHKSVDCSKLKTSDERRKYLSEKQLCFNCTGSEHRAYQCKSKSVCRKCHGRHHTSICDKSTTTNQSSPEKFMTAYDSIDQNSVTYPVVVVEVNGIRCRALLDTGAGSSYASAELLEELKLKPCRREHKRIEMMLGSADKYVTIYKMNIQSVDHKFNLDAEVTKVDRNELMTLTNPRYENIIRNYTHLRDIVMIDTDKKPELPIHLILGTSEYARIKTATKPRIGKSGEPIAELTKLGWTILSPGKESDLTNMFLTQTSHADYEDLCRLDVLGLEDRPTGDQMGVYEEFKEQLRRSPDGWYETSLPWKGNHPDLPNNKTGSLRRLENLVKKLDKQPGMLNNYDAIIRDQLSQGIVEPAPENPQGKEFYIPHKAVVRETAESTKIRIVYDASARANEKAPSLNECLETGPALQNLLWNILTRNRFFPVALTGDLKQAFLQVRIREQDRDVLRFHWLKDAQTREIEVLRFTRALFGLSTSPFLLGGVIEQHLQNMEARYPSEVQAIRRSLYVDDLIGGTGTTDKARHLKESAQGIFGEAGFELHKWHSNISSLEPETTPTEEDTKSYAKENLGVKEGESKLLGLGWNKIQDTLEVTFAPPLTQLTKRGVLGKLARIYDPLGLASPTTVAGKMLYRDVCDSHTTWDKEISADLQMKWKCWENSLPNKIKVPRSIVKHQEEIEFIDLHAFGDASGKGVATAVYAVVKQPSETSQELVVAKARLSKKGLTIPRLELVAGHMSANLVNNVKQALVDLPVREVYGWLDSTVALHWIRGNGEYKQFVHNRVKKIQAIPDIQWRHVSTHENPADVASRGGRVTNASNLWLKGPSWLSNPEEWPEDIITSPTSESQAEAKITKELLSVTVKKGDELDKLLEKRSIWRTVRVMAWMRRFINNSKAKRRERRSGPLNTEDINQEIQFWIKREQTRFKDSDQFKEDQLTLNLQENGDGLLECRGRVQGMYPIYIPPKTLLSEKLVMNAHIQTLHGGVGLSMSHIREKYWIPKLRYLTKKVIRNCYGCKRFQVTAFKSPPQGNLPKDRTEGSIPFQVIAVDYAGPLMYLSGQKSEKKAYILLFACSLTRAIHLDLVPDLTMPEFLRGLKKLIARRGRPKKVYSDNGSTFVGAGKWLKDVMRDEKLQNYLAHQDIRWQYNLSKAPWWGGQFERMVGLVKRALYKTLGSAKLRWEELEEVLLDAEITLNNRPLCYNEDDIQLPTLTPNSMIFSQTNLIPEQAPERIEDRDLRKRAKYILKCKEALWKRWTREYLTSLRERHNLKHSAKIFYPKRGDVLLIKGDSKNRGRWRIGIVEEELKGGDGVVRGVRMRAGKSYLERPLQELFPMELSCDRTEQKKEQVESNQVEEPRPKRQAAVKANEKIHLMSMDNED